MAITLVVPPALGEHQTLVLDVYRDDCDLTYGFDADHRLRRGDRGARYF